MSRSWLPNEPHRWRMFCDACFEHDPQTFSTQPELEPFRDAGWFIGKTLDACPQCHRADALPGCPPHKIMAEQVSA